jgi:monoamine oxidase
MTTVVIGAGIAGLYTAWRMATSKAHRRSTIKLFHDGDASAVGGRLQSCACPETGAVFNMGAGRISRGQHPRASALVDALGLAVSPFEYQSDSWVIERDRRTVAQLLRERAGDLSIDARLRDCAPMNWHEEAWRVSGEFDEHGTSFVEWISGFVDEQQVRKIQDRHGYGILGNRELPVSEARRILQQHPETQHGDDWIEPVAGFQAIAQALAARLEALDVEIVHEHRLVEIAQLAGQPHRRLSFLHRTAGRSVDADRVVLAMPQQALLSLVQDFEPDVRDALHSVSPVPLFKLFVIFESPWWEEAGFCAGDCVRTDLELQKVYFRADGSALIYCDSAAAEHWARLMASDAERPGTLQRVIARQLGELAAVDADVVRVKRMHAKFWRAGVHFWRIGVSPRRVHDLLLGDPAGGLHICGEAFSPNSGWIEGALESVDALIDRLDRFRC